MRSNVGRTIPDTGKAFVNIRDIPTDQPHCACGNAFSTEDDLAHYPVRIVCGDIFCYCCADVWLRSPWKDCPHCDSPLGDLSLVREDIDSQLEQFREALQIDDGLFARSCTDAALRLQQSHFLFKETSSDLDVEMQLDVVRKEAAGLWLKEPVDGPDESSVSDEDLAENVSAALFFLDVTPRQASLRLTLNDLVMALSVLGLSHGQSAAKLSSVLRLLGN